MLPITRTGATAQMMNDGYIEDDFFNALYVALDRLEEPDPETRNEPWFKLLESGVDKTLAPHIEKAYREKKKPH